MISPPRKATSFRELRRVCRPRPLEGEQLEAFFVETDQARNPYQHTRELVKTTLDEYTDARIGVNERALAGVRDYFAKVTETKQSGHDTTAGVEAQAGAGVSAVLGSLLSLFGQFKGEIRYNAHSTSCANPGTPWPPIPSCCCCPPITV